MKVTGWFPETNFIQRFFLLAGIAFCPWHSAAGQGLPVNLQNAIDSLLRQGEIRSGEQTFQDAAVLMIGQQATFDELLLLSHDTAPLLRVAALYGLLRRDEQGKIIRNEEGVVRPYLHVLLEQRFADTARVRWQKQGEYASKTSYSVRVGDIWLYKVGNYWNGTMDNLLSDAYAYRIPESARRHFDSLLILQLPNPWDQYRFSRIRQLKPIPAWHAAIRRQVKYRGDVISTCYLAKYQDPRDITLILQHLPADLPQPEHQQPTKWVPFLYFQHPRLFAYLKRQQPIKYNRNGWLMLVSAYQTDEAAKLLDTIYEHCKTIGKEQWYRIPEISNSLNAYFAPVYALLMWKILMENPENSNIRIPQGLWDSHADSLTRYYYIWKAGGRNAQERAATMFAQLSVYLKATDVPRQIMLVMEQIKLGAEPRNSQKAWETIWLAHDTAYTAPLITLLKKEPLAENRFFICKILLHQPEPDIREQLIFFFRQYPELYPLLPAAEKGGVAFSDFLYYIKKKQ